MPAWRVDVLPVEPGNGAVLAICVVVALLRASHFVAHGEHRPTFGEEQDREEILDLPAAERFDRRDRRVGPSTPQFQLKLSFVPSLVVLAVGLVVLVVVGHQVVEREAVVGRDEVDAAAGESIGVIEQLGAPHQVIGQRADRSRSSPLTNCRTWSRNWPFQTAQRSPPKFAN